MLDSCFVQLKFDYNATKNLDVHHIVDSEEVSAAAGGHRWWIKCYPRGYTKAVKGEYVSIYLQLASESKSRSVKAIFEAFPVDMDGAPSSSHAKRFVEVHPFEGFHFRGWSRFVKRSDLEPLYVVDGCVTILCGVIVVRDDCPLSVPPSDIGDHLGHLLTAADGSDVSFVVGGKSFAAHRAVLAARSPVFKAELFGSMAETTMSCITLQDIDPATFQLLLRFMYIDVVMPDDDDELGDGDDSPMEMYQRLLAACDRYAMDRLKMMCASKLWDDVSVDTVADVLACAETYSCPELKEKCVVFLVDDKNFKKAVLTDGFVKLVQRFPSFIAELREKAGR